MKHYLYILLFFSLSSHWLSAQTFTMAASGTTSATSCTGTLLDPGGAGNYIDNQTSVITINPATAGNNVRLTFTAFDTESGWDFVDIFDGSSTASPSLGTFSGTTIPAAVTASGGPLTVRFRSDVSNVRAGFSATISCVAPTGSVSMPASGSTSITTCATTLLDPGGTGNYIDNQTSVITINPATAGNNVRLTFTAFNTESGWDFVDIYDGSSTASPLLGSFSGTTIPAAVTATGGPLTVRFRSDASNVRAGFAATISCVTAGPPPGPGYVMSVTSGSATTCSGTLYDSGGAAGGYGVSEDRSFTITPSTAGAMARLVLTMIDLESCCDYIQIYNGPSIASPMLVQLAGNTLPTITSYTSTHPTGAITVVFHSDGSVQNTGFAATISCFTPPATINTNACSGTFTDGAGNYANDMNQIYTICPNVAGSKSGVQFTAFNLEDGRDYMYVYDGNSIAAPPLGIYTGTVSPGIVAASPANASGCLTFRFTSDAATVLAGWAATITCTVPCQTITASVSTTPAASGGVTRICQNGSVTLNGSGVFSSSSTGATYRWRFSDGVTATGASVTRTFATPGSYTANLTITDPSGCQNTNSTVQTIQVSTTPTFATTATPASLCVGATSTLTGAVTMTPFTPLCTPPVSGTTFLPDGSGVSYSTSINVNCYSAGQVLTSATDINRICLNMEHSWLGDLNMRLICPNGQSTILHAYPTPANNSYYLGAAIDDVTSGPGTGLNYCFNNISTTFLYAGGTASRGTPAGTSINAGDYQPTQSFTNLVGCPVNGTWTVEITDNIGSDDGYIFNWDLDFAATLPISSGSPYTPTVSSATWVAAAGLTSVNSTTATVVPATAGSNCYIYRVVDNFGCTYDAAPRCVTAIAAPTPSVSGTNVICAGGSTTLTASGGTSYAWSNGLGAGASKTVSPASNTTYTVTATNAAGCTSVTTYSVTVNPLHSITAGSSQTVCRNTAITNITMTLGGGATGATVTGLPAGVTMNVVGTTATISGTPTASGSFAYTVTTTGNACATATATGTITVTPLNTVTAGTSQTVCMNSAITTISLNTTGATGATVTGLPAGVTGVWAANVVTISGTPTASGPFTYTVTTTGGCPPATTTGTITVNPAHTITAATNATACLNTVMTSFSMTLGGGANNANVTGLPSGVGSNVSGGVLTISGTPTSTGVFNYSVTTVGNTCTPVVVTGTITVNPAHTITPASSPTICANAPMTSFTMTLGGGATGATVTGLPTGVTSSVSGTTLTISGTPTVTGPFNYTVTTTGNACPAATTNGTITVNPAHTITPATNRTVCVNTVMTSFSMTLGGGANNANVLGLPSGVGSNVSGGVLTISGTPTSSGVFNYSVTTVGNTCTPVVLNGTITVTPLNTITAGTSQTVCRNSAITTISLNTTGATGATVTGLPAGVTGVWAGNVVTISGTPTASGSFTYTVTTTGGCPPATTTGTITVTPLNTITAGTSQTVCRNSAITTISLNTTGATGATVTGLPAGVTGVWAGNVVTISGTPTASGSFTYTVTTTGGCPPATTTGTITVTPLNTITAGTSQTVCMNSAITTISLNTTGATGATVTGLPAGVTGVWAGNVVTISGTPTASGSFTYTVTTTGGCPPATTTGTITVTPLNTITAGTSQTVCRNSAITTISLNTTGATGATVTGLPAGVTGVWAGNVVTISGTPTASGSFTYTVTTTGGCPPATTTGTITVTPLNTITAGTSQTVCRNSAITTISLNTTGATGATVTGLPAGVTGVWAGNVVTISGTPTASGSFTYTVTTTGGCPPATTTGTITVTPLNTITAGTSQTVCRNSAITTISLNTTGATGATVTGLPAGVTGVWAGNVVTISGTPTASGSFTYTVTTTGGCPPATTTGTITVTPLNTITAGTSQTVCRNSAITTISLNTTGATGATVTGLPAGVTGVWAGNVVTISGTPTASGSFTYTVTTTGGCPPATTTGTITVTPLNTITAGTSQTVCMNSAITTISLNTTGATGATVTGLPAGVTGVWAGNVVTISGTPTASGSFTYTVTTTGGCPPATTTGTITVTPLNTITAGTSQTVCMNSAITTISLNTTGATGATVTGLPAGVTGVWAGNVVTISGTPTASGSFTYTVTTTGGCPPATTTGTITVTPLNTITAGTSQTVCRNSAITTISLNTTGATGATVTGLPAGVTGVWAGNVVTISGTPTASGSFTYTVTTTGGCPPATTTGTITVTPLNTITAGTSQTVCRNSAITTISLNTTGATGATVTGLPAGVTGVWAANVVTISGTPTASGSFTYTVTTTGGCPPATTTGTITVTPLNTITAGTSQTVCRNSAITTISLNTTGATGATVTGLPAGVTGVWAGNVVTISGTPTASGSFTYTVTTTGGCPPATTTGTITVTPLNTITAGTSQTVCRNSAITTISLNTTGATGATVTGLPAGVTGVWAGNVVTISGTPTASGSFTYTVTTTGGCPPATTTGTITVTPLNTVTAGINRTTCINSAITSITLNTTGATGATVTGLPAGVTGVWAGNVVTISGTPTASGSFTYTVTTTGGCPPATTTGTITVDAVPTANAGANAAVCENATHSLSGSVTNATGASWSTSGSGTFNNANITTPIYTPSAADVSAGAVTLTIASTGSGACPAATSSAVLTMNTISTPPVLAPFTGTICPDSDAFLTVTGGTTGTGATIQWYSGANGTGSLVASGISATVAPITTTTYYVRREGVCNTTTDAVVTVNVKTFIYALNGTSTTTYCTDNAGWHHFYTGDEIILSLQGDVSSMGTITATILDNGAYYMNSTNPLLCASYLTPGEQKFEMERSWNIAYSGAINGLYNVRFYYQPSERAAVETAAANWLATYTACGYSYKYNPGALGWFWFKNTVGNYAPPVFEDLLLVGIGNGAVGGINYSILGNIASFSGGTGGVILTPDVLLSTELVNFRGRYDAQTKFDVLNWETNTETNNARFEIERSATAADGFVKIGEVAGHGTTTTPQAYQFNDTHPLLGINYYRLRQVDFDNTVTYSQIIAIETPTEINNYVVYPNPTAGTVTYQFYLDAADKVQIEVLNVLGQTLQTQSFDLMEGAQRLDIDLSNYPNAAYTLRITHTNSNATRVEKIIKARQ